MVNRWLDNSIMGKKLAHAYKFPARIHCIHTHNNSNQFEFYYIHFENPVRHIYSGKFLWPSNVGASVSSCLFTYIKCRRVFFLKQVKQSLAASTAFLERKNCPSKKPRAAHTPHLLCKLLTECAEFSVQFPWILDSRIKIIIVDFPHTRQIRAKTIAPVSILAKAPPIVCNKIIYEMTALRAQYRPVKQSLHKSYISLSI